MDVMAKILIGFMDVQSFTKMVEEEKYSIKFACRWQYGGNCIEIFRDGVLITEIKNMGERAIAKAKGYDIILDHWAERNGFEWNQDMLDGGIHIRLSDAAKNIHPELSKEQFNEYKKNERNKFVNNWNKMVEAVKKYNPS